MLGKEACIDVHPNPANSLIDVSAKFVVEQVSIYSMGGRKISDKMIDKEKFSIDLAELSPGDYFLVFKTKSKGLITKRISKK